MSRSAMKEGTNIESGAPIVFVDLDNTLAETFNFLVDHKYIEPQELGDMDAIVRGYIRAGSDLLNAEPINNTILLVRNFISLGYEVYILTARVSVPAQITIRQINKLFPDLKIPVLVADNKIDVLRSIVVEKDNARNIPFVMLIDDVQPDLNKLDVCVVPFIFVQTQLMR